MEPPAQPWPPRREAGPDDATQGFGPLPGYGPPGSPGPSADEPPPLRPDGPARARTGLVVLVAVLFEFVVVAGWGNQWVSDRINRHLDNISSLFGRNLVSSTLNYSWRFSPRGGSDPGHLWLGQLLLPVTFLVVSALLIAAAVRGVVTFWRAFFATWTAVLAATVVAAIVRGAIIDPAVVNGPGRNDRATSAFFGPAGPNASVVVAGIAFGLLVALLTAIIAVATRRRPMVPVTAEATDGSPQRPIDAPPPFYGDVPDSGGNGNQADVPRYGYGVPDRADGPEGARHAADPSTEDTRRLPLPDVEGPSAGGPAASGAADQDADSTMQLPRPVPSVHEPAGAEPTESQPEPVASPEVDSPAPRAADESELEDLTTTGDLDTDLEPAPAPPEPAPTEPAGPETTRFADPRN